MNKANYQAALLNAMKSNEGLAVANINSALECWPEKATSFGFDLFIDQDAEGFVSLLITPDGPDSYVLNKAIHKYRYLFEVKFEGAKLTYDLPLFDTDDIEFDVRDAVSETALKWVNELVGIVGKLSFPVPVRFSNCCHETKFLT